MYGYYEHKSFKLCTTCFQKGINHSLKEQQRLPFLRMDVGYFMMNPNRFSVIELHKIKKNFMKYNFPSMLVSLAKENQISLEAFLESLNKGFLLVKQTQMEKTGKNSITAGDCLTQFFNYSGKNKENFNSLYHLSLVFLYHKKQ